MKIIVPARRPAVRPMERQRQAEPAAGKSPIRRILDALYDTVLVTDAAGRILEANGRAERLLGYRREELRDQPVSRILPRLTPPVVADLMRHVRSGKFAVLEGYCMARGKDRFLAECTAGRLGEKSDSRVLFTLRNIEPRKKTQEMLRAAHNALENAASGIAITDPDGAIAHGNPSFLRIWEFSSLREAVGRKMVGLFDAGDALRDLIAKPLAGEVWFGELEARTIRGRRMVVQVSAAPNRDSDNRLMGTVVSVLDVTARRKAEEALRREAEAQITRAREASEFSGLLTAVTVPDLVQLISTTRKTGTLTILGESDRALAAVGFEEGRARRAECGGDRGETAFFSMLRAPGLGFRFEARPLQGGDGTIERSTMALLLEGMRQADEAEAGPGPERAAVGEPGAPADPARLPE